MVDLTWSIEIKDKDDKQLAKFGSPLYISFDIKRDTTEIPNSAGISVFNLKDSTRKFLQQYAPIDSYNFEAEYSPRAKKRYGLEHYRKIILTVTRNKKDSIIFAGTIIECTSIRNGADWITQFQCGDGFFATRNSNLYTTIDANYNLVETIAEEAKKWKMSVDIAGEPRIPIKPVSFISFKDMLNFAFPNNWFIDNETLKCFGKNYPNYEKQVFVLGGKHIIGSPRRTQNTLVMNTVFMPELKVGQIVDVKSIYARDYNAQWELASISHNGNLGISSGNNANTSILAIPPNTRFGAL